MPEKIAQVVFPLPAEKCFSYTIPASLQKRVHRGSRVRAPLGRRLLTGFVIEVNQGSDLSNLKPISDVLDPYPAFDPLLLRLTHWVAEYYLCSWGEALNAALPSTIHFGGSNYLVLKNPKQQHLLPEKAGKEKQQAVLEALLQNGSKSLTELEKELGKDGFYAAIYDLEEMGYVAIKAREKRVVRLTEIDPAKLKEQVDNLKKKAPHQARLLQILKENGGQLPAFHLTRTWGIETGVVKRLERKGLVEFCFEEPEDFSLAPLREQVAGEPKLSPAQVEASHLVQQALKGGRHQTILLQSFLGADRIPLYLWAISTVLQEGKGVIVLVPEIFLTTKLFAYLQGGLRQQAAVLHSQLSDAERYELWRQIREGRKRVVIGPRSAVFAPVADLGLIVVDEEQDPSYKCESSPRYHARDVALMRARMAEAVVLLGSATPSLESYYNASTGKFSLCRLPRESNSPLPKITIVDVRSLYSKRTERMAILSPLLLKKLKACLQNGKQAVLFQNRRGYATYLQCNQCGFVPQCPNCQVSLTYHRESRQLICHYCGSQQPAPSTCPQCQGYDIKLGGIGTEQVEKTLRSLFPKAKVLRVDLDTTKRKDSSRRLLQFSQGHQADILLGTQMIAKGIDFPDVGLLGVVLADSGLKLPDFRAAEKTFHLLSQLIAGLTNGEVVVQTRSSGDRTIRYFKNHDFDRFALRELADRRELGYPPWGKLLSVIFQGKILENVVSMAQDYAQLLQEIAPQGVKVLGPSEAYRGKLKGLFRWQILLKGKSSRILREVFRECNQKIKGKQGVKVVVDVDPIEMV